MRAGLLVMIKTVFFNIKYLLRGRMNEFIERGGSVGINSPETAPTETTIESDPENRKVALIQKMKSIRSCRSIALQHHNTLMNLAVEDRSFADSRAIEAFQIMPWRNVSDDEKEFCNIMQDFIGQYGTLEAHRLIRELEKRESYL